MNRSSSSRLRLRLVLTALVIVLPAIAIIAYDQSVERHRSHERAIEDTLQLARLAAAQQAAVFDGVERLLLTLARFPSLRDADPSTCDDVLPEVLHDHPGYISIWVSKSDGMPFCSGLVRTQVNSSRGRSWFERAMHSTETVAGEYQLGAMTGKPEIVLAQPIVGPSGRVERILAVAVGVNQLNGIAARAKIPPTATLTLTDRNGTVLARYPNAASSIGKTQTDVPDATLAAAGTREELIESNLVDGRLHAVVPVRTDLVTGLHVTMGIERAAIFAHDNQLLRQHLWLLALVAMLAIGVALVGGQLFVLRPVETFRNVTNRIAAGDFSARAQLAGGPVISDLSDAVNTMAVALETQERRRDEAERAHRSLEEQLRHSQKMEAIGQLAGGIAHDFNNVLTAILGNAEFALDEMAADDRYRSDIEEIVNAARRAAALTQQLLAFSRKQILDPRVLRVGDVVRNLVPMLRRLIGETIDLNIMISDQGNVKADPGQLEQVLVNLAVNARDAMPSGGELTIETIDMELSAADQKELPAARLGRYVMFSVSDTGRGMDEATQKRLFEPFFTTKPKGQGTGLGLATAYGIVNQSEGHILVSSEVGRGTTFKIYLPKTNEVETIHPQRPTESAAPKGTETVLLVEDDTLVRELSFKILTRHGYTVHAMGEPAAAIDFARLHRGVIHLILSDVVLPGMSGRKMVDVLQPLHPEAKVLYMSGYTDDAIVQHGVLCPEMWFIQKPFTADAFVAKVVEVLSSPLPAALV